MSYSTQKKIAQIFKQEVKAKGFEHVSVAKIMEIADMRRQSFYDNFNDKYDLLEWTLCLTMENNIENKLDHLEWPEIISLVFFEIQENATFYRSILESQVKLDVVKEIARHIQTLLLHLLKKKGALKKRPAYDFIEIYCLGLTYMMINNLFLPTPKDYDELAQKVINALDLAFGDH